MALKSCVGQPFASVGTVALASVTVPKLRVCLRMSTKALDRLQSTTPSRLAPSGTGAAAPTPVKVAEARAVGSPEVTARPTRAASESPGAAVPTQLQEPSAP